jgi:hypothetical protein
VVNKYHAFTPQCSADGDGLILFEEARKDVGLMDFRGLEEGGERWDEHSSFGSAEAVLAMAGEATLWTAMSSWMTPRRGLPECRMPLQ